MDITVKAELVNLRRLKDFVHQFLQNQQINEEKTADIELAVEELIVNVMNYSYPPDLPGNISLSCHSENKTLSITIIDEGVPFDPTEAASPDLDGPLADRSQGGMGIFLAKSLVDELTYQQKNKQNILKITCYNV